MNLIFYLLAIVMLQSAASRKEHYPPTSQTSSKGGATGTRAQLPEAAAPIYRFDAEDTQNRTASVEGERDSKSSTDLWLVGLTGGLFLVGLAQAGLFWWQLWLIRASLKDAQKAAEAATTGAEAAKEAAEATRASVDKMQEIAERQLRAYVGVETGGGVNQDFEKRTFFELDPILTNSGQTPAYKLHHIARLAILPFPLPFAFNFPLPPVYDEHSLGVIGAGKQYKIFALAERMYSQEEIDELATLEKRLFIYGIVHYTDVFGWERTTKFCYYVLGDPGQGTWILSSQHNEST